ncbi:fumarylacetoacetate hydrolase family protein [Bradyrhizobium sp. 190]|uniref:fumarylacetoacetate hydrolase family protein n=1 Tax=Bradyrhizobium sp. 190 TaxID=2782658 RepID=UPI001FF77F37|nr:fumarylacetoacetate hydrolase family protein [Bradyrhizobium sp. 190]MCK1513117.1 fumarylacetoacetate hydrolase family protein [Bradyrhizobium sp. 190]
MTDYVFAPPAISSVAVEGEQARFPVRRIFCVGRNYAAHVREMGKDPDREPPFFFTKPADAVVDSGAVVPYPPETSNFHYEIELVVAIDREGFDLAPADALNYVFGYGVGIDLTRRDLQFEARDKGRPWDWGKAFDLSAPIAPLRRVSAVSHLSAGRIWLAVNESLKQDADLKELVWSVPEIISILSRSMVLRPGDLIMTGTPAGVGAIVANDKVTGGIDGLGKIEITIGSARAAS